MTAQFRLREDSEAFGREVERLTQAIEDTERKIVNLRDQRDDARMRQAEARIAAEFLDNAGFRVQRDAAGVLTVSVDPLPDPNP